MTDKQQLTPLDAQAPSTKRMWFDMFGLGEFMKVLADPTLGQQVYAMMGAVIEAAAANKRIEEKLDQLLDQYGIEHERPRASTAVPVGNGTNGTGTHAAATGADHDGGGAYPFADRGAE